MKTFYLDTSAYVTNFTEEPPLTELVTKIFNKCEQRKIKIVTSFWTLSEAIVKIDKVFRRKDPIKYQHEKNAVISSLLGKTLDLVKHKKLVLVVPNEKAIQASWDFIRQRHLSADDASCVFSKGGRM